MLLAVFRGYLTAASEMVLLVRSAKQVEEYKNIGFEISIK